MIEPGFPLEVHYTLDEASNFAGTRLTISSPALTDVVDGGRITLCTSELCDVNWLDGDPFKTADSEWATPSLEGMPEGEYLIEIEASDYDGNEAETVTLSVTIGEGELDPTGGTSGSGSEGSTSGGASTSTGPGGVSGGSGVPPNTTAASTDADPDPGGTASTDAGSSGSSGDAAADGFADRGCGCTSPTDAGGPFGLLLGLLGLGLRRRPLRRRSSRRRASSSSSRSGTSRRRSSPARTRWCPNHPR